jgi:hypothetical protein
LTGKIGYWDGQSTKYLLLLSLELPQKPSIPISTATDCIRFEANYKYTLILEYFVLQSFAKAAKLALVLSGPW